MGSYILRSYTSCLLSQSLFSHTGDFSSFPTYALHLILSFPLHLPWIPSPPGIFHWIPVYPPCWQLPPSPLPPMAGVRTAQTELAVLDKVWQVEDWKTRRLLNPFLNLAYSSRNTAKEVLRPRGRLSSREEPGEGRKKHNWQAAFTTAGQILADQPSQSPGLQQPQARGDSQRRALSAQSTPQEHAQYRCCSSERTRCLAAPQREGRTDRPPPEGSCLSPHSHCTRHRYPLALLSPHALSRLRKRAANPPTGNETSRPPSGRTLNFREELKAARKCSLWDCLSSPYRLYGDSVLCFCPSFWNWRGKPVWLQTSSSSKDCDVVWGCSPEYSCIYELLSKHAKDCTVKSRFYTHHVPGCKSHWTCWALHRSKQV